MSTTRGVLGAALIVTFLVGTVHLGCRGIAPSSSPPVEHLFTQIKAGDAEARYHATLALSRYGTKEVRSRLRALLESEEPLTRNAAARALVDLGEKDATAVLIANLDRRLRTWAVTDAIHHLRQLYGTDRGYDPNRGYSHQIERQGAWWTWWEARGGTRPPEREWPDTAKYAVLYAKLTSRVAAYEALEGAAAKDWKTTAALWRAVGELAPSRDPEHIDLVARAFGAMAERQPDKVALWNNHALASLNVSRYDDAEAGYKKALALAPDDAFLNNDYGILLEGLGRLPEAEAQYRAAVRHDPKDATWRGNLGDVLAARGRRVEAIAAYREAERLKPEVWYYHRLAISRMR